MTFERRFVDCGGDWTVEERINSDGHGSRAYYYRDQLAVTFDPCTKASRQLAGFTLIEKDLRTIRAWVAGLRDLVNALPLGQRSAPTFMPTDDRMIPARALYVAVVTTYGKLFTEGAGRGASLHRNGWVPAAHQELHDSLMHQRHTFTAHSGVGSPEGCNVVVAIDYSRKGRTPPRLFTELHQPAGVSASELDKLDAWLAALQVKVAARLEKAIVFVQKEADEMLTEARLRALRKGASGRMLRRK